MINSEAIKLQLVQDIINLPDDELAVVQNLLANLMGRNAANGAEISTSKKAGRDNRTEATEQQPITDPLLALIGCVSYDPPQKSIDEELYGEDPLGNYRRADRG